MAERHIEDDSASSDPFATQFGPADLCGLTIPGFTVIEEIGRGAFGVVYRALDQTLDRTVAVKVSLLNDPTKRREYLREAQNAAKLDFPGIVTVHSVGTLPSGQPFVVQRLIEGASLRKMLETQGAFQLHKAAALICDIASTIAEAHARGIIHRDLKPDNILVDQSGKPWVADFGLAISESDQNNQQTERAGTPLYMSPEQLKGRTDWLDGRTDIYSLGIMFYELLVGRTPFTANNFKELEEQILYREPKPISQRVSHIPPEIDQIFNKCCAKKLSDRYANAYEIVEALQQLLVQLSDPQAIRETQKLKASTVASNNHVLTRPDNSAGASTKRSNGARASTKAVPSQIGMSTKRPFVSSHTVRDHRSTKAQRNAVVAGLSCLLLLTLIGFAIAVLSTFDGPHSQGGNTEPNKPVVTGGTNGPDPPPNDTTAVGTDDSNKIAAATENSLPDATAEPVTPKPDRDVAAIEPKPTVSVEPSKSTANDSTADTPPVQEKPAPPTPVRPKELRVSTGGTGSHTSIQAALNVANAGETIFIESGKYVESLLVSKSVRFEGVGERSTVTVTGLDKSAVTIRQAAVEFRNVDFQLASSKAQTEGMNTIELESGALKLSACSVYCPSYDGINASPNSQLIALDCDFFSHNHPAIKINAGQRLDVQDSRFNIKALPGKSVPFGIQAIGTPGIVKHCEFTGEGAHGIDWQKTTGQTIVRDCIFTQCKWGMHFEDCDAVLVDGTNRLTECEFALSLVKSQASITGVNVESIRGAIGIKIVGSAELKNRRLTSIVDSKVLDCNEGLAISDFSQVTATNLTLERNTRGAVVGAKANLSLDRCQVVGNTEVGVQVEAGTLHLTGCRLLENNFGARVNGALKAMVCEESEFVRNRAGISIFSGIVECSDTKFQNATAGILITKPQSGRSHGHPIELTLNRVTMTECEKEILGAVPCTITENNMTELKVAPGKDVMVSKVGNRTELKP